MNLISKVTEIYCIADDFCKDYELELNKKALSLSNPSPNTPKTRNRKGRMSEAEMITILVLFHSNTFRNFKHFYLFYVWRELKEEFPNLLSYIRFVERMPRVVIPLLLFLKLALMGHIRSRQTFAYTNSLHIYDYFFLNSRIVNVQYGCPFCFAKCLLYGACSVLLY